MKNAIVIFAFAALLVFAGCVSVEYTHTQKEDGRADLLIRMDATGMVQLQGQAAVTAGLQQSCGELEGQVQGLECEVDGVDLTISRHYTKDSAFYSFRDEGDLFLHRYVLEIDTVPTVGRESGGQAINTTITYTRLSDPAGLQSAQAMRAVGITAFYTVQMPGEIKEADGSMMFSGSTAKYDLLSLMGVRKMRVVSESMNPVGYALALGGILAVAAAAYVLLSRKKQPSGRRRR
ncbi:hypothetical protein H0O01_04355 [Candidatus Micrarchaeota archaeon]|nr:hypothetical protein [Candidatus Micrarchaeota archaeon]